jgi:hypothetical protein
MPDDKTKGLAFPAIIETKLANGEIVVLLTVQVNSQGETTVTVFKEDVKNPETIKGEANKA